MFPLLYDVSKEDITRDRDAPPEWSFTLHGVYKKFKLQTVATSYIPSFGLVLCPGSVVIAGSTAGLQ